MSNHYEDALTAAIGYQTKIAQLHLILRPAIELAEKDFRSAHFMTTQEEVEKIFKSLREAAKLLGVE